MKPNKDNDKRGSNQSQNSRRRVVDKQPRKDSSKKRVNYDNTRISKFERDEKLKDCRSNDVNWYTKNGELLKSATATNFITTTGLKPEVGGTQAVPGIMTIHWSPVFGSIDDDPMNQAKNSKYSFVVHANSRNQSYDAPDLMVLTLAGFNVFAALAAGIRAYGTMRLFEGQDYYTPQALVSAMGFNYQDLQSNLSNMWFDLNEMIARTKQIWVPTDMPLLNRWYWMSSNIYRDGNSVKSQYYMFVPTQFYMYTPGTSSNPGSSLVPSAWGSSMTWNDYKFYINRMISSLLQADSRGLIYGDILKAYGADNIFALNPISVDYQVEPVYDIEVLTQIENLTIAGITPGSVTQDLTTNNLHQHWPVVKATEYTPQMAVPSVQVLNFHQTTAPTQEQIMVATRLKCASNVAVSYTGSVGETPASGEIAPWTYGTEIVTTVRAYYYNWVQGTPTLSFQDMLTVIKNSGTSGFNRQSMYMWSAFDWAPWIYPLNGNVFPSGAYIKEENAADWAIGDYDNYAYVTDIELNKMNTTAVYSEFGVPTL